MTRLLALAAVALFYPATASAQAAIPPRMAISTPASGTGHGITVNGTATGRVAATLARAELSVMTADRKLSLDAASLQPVVDALIKAGADPGSVHLPPNLAAPGYSNNATITASFTNPTVAEMQSGILSVGAVIAAQKDLVLTGAQVQLTAANCSSAADGVRHNAVQNALRKAQSLASDLGVHIGSAIDVRAFDQVAADGSCEWQYNLNGYGGFNPQTPQAPSDYVTVPITSNVTITYAIK